MIKEYLNKLRGFIMNYDTFLLIASFQFLLILPLSFYFMTIGFIGLFFTLFMVSGLIAIIALYYPLIRIND